MRHRHSDCYPRLEKYSRDSAERDVLSEHSAVHSFGLINRTPPRARVHASRPRRRSLPVLAAASAAGVRSDAFSERVWHRAPSRTRQRRSAHMDSAAPLSSPEPTASDGSASPASHPSCHFALEIATVARASHFCVGACQERLHHARRA